MKFGAFCLLIVAKVSDVVGQYAYGSPDPYSGLHQRKFILDTQNGYNGGDGSFRWSVKRHWQDACRLRLNFVRPGNPRYLNCGREYVTAGRQKICGRLPEGYVLPFKEDIILTYRGKPPLEIEVEHLDCKEMVDTMCDHVIQDLRTDIASPNYPRQYPPLYDCKYTIRPLNEAICQVSIFFHDFDVEDSPNCTKDRLLIGSQVLCGSHGNHRINLNLTSDLTIRFISDQWTGGRGFKASVEQIHCGNTLHRYQGYVPRPNDESRACCMGDFEAPHLLLTSPGFLGSQWTDSDCGYTILRSHPTVCRLRFLFRHFWVGDEDVFYGCVNGFLEIDGKRFCGCLDGYEYVSFFNGEPRKELWYMHRGTGKRGFLIEVHQEECNEGSHPFPNNTDVDPNTEIEIFGMNITSDKGVSRFLVPRDSSRCYLWTQPGWPQQIRNFFNSSPIPGNCISSDIYEERGYPFANSYGPSQFPVSQNVFPPVLPPAPPSIIPPELIPMPRPIPPILTNPVRRYRGCILLDSPNGEFFSPYYPTGYPPNVKECYVFARMPGFCKVEVKFIDFDLMYSFKCWKDYLLVENAARFCGQYLRDKTIGLDFRYNGFSYLHFHSDKFFSGRGFYGKYWQWPCLDPFTKLPRARLVSADESSGLQNQTGRSD